jgi:hypothetical protein
MNRAHLGGSCLVSCLWLLGIGVSADAIIDPADCSVLPPDTYEHPRLIGTPTGDGSGPYSGLHIVIRNTSGFGVPNVFIEVEFHAQCAGSLCLCDGIVLSGYTDQQGCLDLNLDLGGCCERSDAARIYFDGGVLRTYPIVVSPDNTSPQGGGDCIVNLPDFSMFSAGLSASQGGCFDYTGDEQTTLVDFVVFGDAWGESCTGGRR